MHRARVDLMRMLSIPERRKLVMIYDAFYKISFFSIALPCCRKQSPKVENLLTIRENGDFRGNHNDSSSYGGCMNGIL